MTSCILRLLIAKVKKTNKKKHEAVKSEYEMKSKLNIIVECTQVNVNRSLLGEADITSNTLEMRKR